MHPSPSKSFKSPSPRSVPSPHQARYIHSRTSSPHPQSSFAPFQPLTSDSTPYSTLLLHTFQPSLPIAPPSDQHKISMLNKPFKILEAPELLDNFYYSILDWGSCNTISVGLSKKIFLIQMSQGRILNLLKGDSNVTSVKFDELSTNLAAGCENGEILVFDLNKGEICRNIQGHKGRVGVCKWNRGVLTTGGSDTFVLHTDLRAPDSFCKVKAHTDEICGLEWNEDTLATGSNDNTIKIWQDFNQTPICTLQGHTSAVKSMAWSPFDKNILLSGGGANDKTIKVWDTNLNKSLKEIYTGSQVCSLLFSKNSKEFVTGHGYSKNEIVVWNYSRLEEKETFQAHEDRVLYMAISPDGRDLVTGAGDKTLRFWNLFKSLNKKGDFEELWGNGFR